MSLRRRKRPPRPPKRRCRECGADVYAWAESPLCTACVRDVRPPGEREGETIGEFRRRVIDPDRNG